MSMSSQGSPSRKRKSPFESPSTSGLTNKRHKSRLGLKKDYLEHHSQLSNDSTRFDDEDTRSFSSVSYVSLPSEKMLTSDAERDYSSLAAKYGVKSTVAKKYYLCLMNQPRVTIIPAPPIDLPSKLSKIVTRKQRPEISSFSNSNYSTISHKSVNRSCVQNENSVNAGPVISRDLDKTTKLKMHNFFKSISNNNCITKELLQKSSSTDLTRPNNVTYNSHDEFKCSKYKRRNNSEDKQDKKGDIIPNPFSVNGQKRISSQKRKNNRSAKYGHLSKNKMNLDNFAIKKETGDKIDYEYECGYGEIQLNEQVVNKKIVTQSQERTSKKSKYKRLRIHDDTDSEEEQVDAKSNTSLSVNCQYLNTYRNTETEGEDHLKNSGNQMSPLMSFGECYQIEDADIVDVEEVENMLDDIIDLCVESPKCMEQTNEEPVPATNNLANGINSFDGKSSDDLDDGIIRFDEKSNDNPSINASNEESEDLDMDDGVIQFGEKTNDNLGISESHEKSDNLDTSVSEERSNSSQSDIFDSPVKSNSPGRLVVDLTPSANTETEVTNGGSSPLNSNGGKSKGKPRIKSDTKLKNNKYVIARKQLKKTSKSTSSPSPAKSDEVQTPSKKGKSNEFDPNGSTTPTTRGINLQQVKCNLNDEESVKEYRNAKSNDTDETFDALCQDINILVSTNSEGITLYKGTEEIESSTDNVVVLNKSLNEAQDKGSSTSLTEAPAPTDEKVLESPKRITRQSQRTDSTGKIVTEVSTLKFGETSDNATTPKRPTRRSRPLARNLDSPTVSPLLGFPRIPRKDSRLNNSASLGTLSSRDPRLNRSLSPTKPVNSSVGNARVTRSSSISLQMSPGVSSTDPRLTRGQSRPRSSTPTPNLTAPTNISPSIENGAEENIENIVDPRLRKRKMREEAQKTAATVAEAASASVKSSNDASLTVEPEPPKVSQFGNSDLCSPTKERRSRNVFQRLGIKESSPLRKSPARNEFINIIKSRDLSPTKTPVHELDDDDISLHPHQSDFYESDEDDENSSPRHQKFVSERSRTADSGTSSSSTMQSARQRSQQRLPVKERIGSRPGGVADHLLGNSRRAPISAPSVTSSTLLAPPIRPPPMNYADALAHRQARFGLVGARPPAPTQQQQRQIQQPSRGSIETVPPPSLNVPPPRMSSHQYGSSFSFEDRFYQLNAEQMIEDQKNMDIETSEGYVTFENGNDRPNEFDYVSILDDRPADNTAAQRALSDPKHTFFHKQCFRELREGKCQNALTKCMFQHQTAVLLKKVKTQDPLFVKAIINRAIEFDFNYFLDNVWSDVLSVVQDDPFAMYKQLYVAGKRGRHYVIELLRHCLSTKSYTPEKFIKEIAPIIDDNDSDTVQAICVAIKSKLEDGFYWEVIKPICQKAAPPKDMVEVILMQCLSRKKNITHIQEVFDLVKKKLIKSVRDSISTPLIKQFYDLAGRMNIGTIDKEILNTMPLVNVTNNLTNGPRFERQSVNPPKAVVQAHVQQKGLAKSTISRVARVESFTPRSPDATPTSPENQRGAPVDGESQNLVEYNVKEVDAPEPVSGYRDRFWKLYAAVQCVKDGLMHIDYDYVWEQLDKYAQEDLPNQFCKRGFYHVLCKDIKMSQHHLSQILRRAVMKSSEKASRLLFEVGVLALNELCNSELYVTAEELLKDLLPFRPETLPTTFILISAEVYLANCDPVEALYLLQRTKLIRTNRDEWLVNDSKKSDEKHRNAVVFILLESLAYLQPEIAVFLFKELLADQYIYYFPIDLSRFLDKFTLLLLYQKKLDLAAEIARLAMDNDMRFQKSTFQELLSWLLPVDEVLVNQILEYAVNLGYYNDLKIKGGFITLILDINYTEEEIYLILKRLIRKLAINLGPTIPRLKSTHLKVTLVFEDIPTDQRLYKNETVTKINLNKNRQMRDRVGHLLSTRFSPPIKLSQRKADRFCKIMSASLVNHLKNWQ